MKRLISVLSAFVFLLSVMCGCMPMTDNSDTLNIEGPVKSMELSYADQFSIDYYKDGFKYITLADGSRFLVIPEGKELPQKIPSDVTPLYQPLNNIYLAATSAMCLFDALNRTDAIKLSGTKKDGWYIDSAKKAMENGDILYAGKYSEPDYELILENSCPLAIESTMIGHASDVKEKLEKLKVAVLVDLSSQENHPLGRSEWIKLYGALLNEEETAEKLFREQALHLESVTKCTNTEKTVAFFHISSSGLVVARKSGDYVSKMISLAGGKYVFDNLGDSKKNTSTVTIEMEKFYETAKDADFIIYNSTIGGEIKNKEELLALNNLLKDFKAVKEGNVWCTSENMFQESMKLGQMIKDFNDIFIDNNTEKTKFLYKLK